MTQPEFHPDLANVDLAIDRARRIRKLGSLGAQVYSSRAPTEQVWHQNAIFTFLARSLTAFEVVLDLTERGYPAESLMVMRSLCELDIDLTYITMGDVEERLRRYWEYGRIIALRQLESWMAAGKKVSPDVRRKIKAEAGRVGPNYKGKHDSWCGKSIEQRAKETKRLAQYTFAYDLGCQATHSGERALRFSASFEAVGDDVVGTVTIGPTERSAVPLNCAIGPMLQILSTVDRHCQLGLDHPLGVLFDEMNAMGHAAAAFDGAAHE